MQLLLVKIKGIFYVRERQVEVLYVLGQQE